MKNHRNITEDSVIVESPGSPTGELEYRVKNGAHLTLILQSAGVIHTDTKIRVRLISPGARALIIGLVIARGDSVIRLHTMQEHEAPETTSNLIIKTALYDRANCVIDGGILVTKGAQKTDAYQRNENLLMSETTHAESKPSLEILANDVRCTHGATVGPVSDEELWYLATRGISRRDAEPLIVAGFFNKTISLIDDPAVRAGVWKSVEAAL